MINYCKFVNSVNECYNEIYNIPIAKKIIDYSSYSLQYIYSTLINKKLEPMSSYWISSIILSKGHTIVNEMKILQHYEFINNPLDIVGEVTIIEKCFNETCDSLDTIVLNSQNYVEGLVKMKIGKSYVYRVFDNTSGFFSDFELPLISSSVKFLTIEYIHPIMNKTIFIELDNSVYFENNQILSAAFIKLYLEHQSELYHFDFDYILKVMDNNLKTFSLKFDKSVLLLADEYKIV